MASFFELELDTTAPTIEASIPEYIGYGYNFIEIHGSEELSQTHQIVLEDSIGYRKALIFTVENNIAFGILDVTSMSPGTGYIYVRLYDKLLNKSKLFKRKIEILDTRETFVSMQVFDAEIDVSFIKNHITFDFKENFNEIESENCRLDLQSQSSFNEMEIKKAKISLQILEEGGW